MQHYYIFPSPVIFEVSGKDAERYLQARLTNNIKTLTGSNSLQAAALSPQGRTEGFYHIIKTGEQSFTLIGTGGDYEAMITAFKRYKVADRFEIADLRNSKRLINIAGTESVLNAFLHDAGIAYRTTKSDSSGINILIENESLEQFKGCLEKSQFTEIDQNNFNYLRIRSGTPSYPEELNDSAVFLEADAKESVSFNKGCYVGQEVIEKVDSHGRLAKKLTRIKFPGIHQFERLAKIKFAADEDETVGKLYSFANAPDGSDTVAFASIDSELTSGTKLICNKIAGELI